VNGSAGHRARTLAAFAFLAALASWPRFGQRENPDAVLSDSDYYLDMAAVFAGRKPTFDPVWSAAGHVGAHHYARPLLPFLAGRSSRALALDVRVAFSVVNVVSAWIVAAALYLLLARTCPALRLAWLPSALFLTGFPQLDWGYHLLTDTLGYATTVLAAVLAWVLLRWPRAGAGVLREPRFLLGLAGLFTLQALALLARETAWFVPVTAGWLLLRAGFPRKDTVRGIAVLVVLLLAVVPRILYLERYGVHALELPFSPRAWADPGYVVDLLVKSAVAFHFVWVIAALGLRRGGWRAAPDFLLAWTVAALLYVGAGYAVNSLAGIGYPLRITYALFPMVYFLAAWGVERIVPPRWTTAAASALVALNLVVGIVGIALDPGGSLTVTGLIQR
jgi:hypothetical protein